MAREKKMILDILEELKVPNVSHYIYCKDSTFVHELLEHFYDVETKLLTMEKKAAMKLITSSAEIQKIHGKYVIFYLNLNYRFSFFFL